MSKIIPCRGFANGYCARQDKCNYDHVLVNCVMAEGQLLSFDEELQKSSISQTRFWSNINPTEYHCTRVFGGGVAIFGPGAECVGFRPKAPEYWTPRSSVDDIPKNVIHLGAYTEITKYNRLQPALLEYLNRLRKPGRATYVWSSPSEIDKTSPILSVTFIDAETMEEAKTAIAKIMSGEVVRDGNHTVWHNSFGDPEGMAQLNKIGKLHGMLGGINKQKHQVKLHAQFIRLNPSWQKCREDIVALFQDKERDSFTISLTPAQARAAFIGGYKAIALHLGKDSAILDLTSVPRCIRINGSKEDLNKAKVLLKSFITPDNEGRDVMCPLCFEKPSDSMFLTCNHVYCQECFEMLCLHDFTDPIRCCKGHEPSCKLLFLIELQAYLEQDQFERILTRSFDRYIYQSDKLFHCPSPDCSQVHKVSNRLIVCRTCSETICTRCRTVNHVGLTCQAYQSKLKEQEASWREGRDIKDCPKCGIAIQKEEGCNHFQCGRCATHFCWACLQKFARASEVYDHFGEGMCDMVNDFVADGTGEDNDETDEDEDVNVVAYGVVHLPRPGTLQGAGEEGNDDEEDESESEEHDEGESSAEETHV